MRRAVVVTVLFLPCCCPSRPLFAAATVSGTPVRPQRYGQRQGLSAVLPTAFLEWSRYRVQAHHADKIFPVTGIGGIEANGSFRSPWSCRC